MKKTSYRFGIGTLLRCVWIPGLALCIFLMGTPHAAAACVSANGVVQAGEECDDGANGDDTDGCNDSCERICEDGAADGNFNESYEECDDGGDGDDLDGCTDRCLIGCIGGSPNGTVQSGEECDDGNMTEGDGCNNRCVYEFCGNGNVDLALGEECDYATEEPGSIFTTAVLGCVMCTIVQGYESCGPVACYAECGDGLVRPKWKRFR